MASAKESAMDKELSNHRVRKLWEHQTVGGAKAKAEVGSAAYFQQLKDYRYGYEHPFIPSFFRFPEMKNKKVLEVGVGTGIDAVTMAQNGAEYFGLDIARNHLNLTRANFEINAPGYKPVLMEGDLTTNPIGEQFDIVYSFGVLHHIHHEEDYLNLIWERLKPGGRLMVALYAKHSFFNVYLVATWIAKLKFLKTPFNAWQSHVSEGSTLDSPVVIKIRSKKEIVKLYESAGFKLVNYQKHGFVQNNLPIVGKFLDPDGSVLNRLGGLLGWYHLCEFVKCERSTQLNAR